MVKIGLADSDSKIPVYLNGKRTGSIILLRESDDWVFQYIRVSGSFVDFEYKPIQSCGGYHSTLDECVDSLPSLIL